MSILLTEPADVRPFYPVSATRFIWNIRCGIFPAKERAVRKFGDVKTWSSRYESLPWTYFKGSEDAYSVNDRIDGIISAKWVLPYDFAAEDGVLYTDTEGVFLGLFDGNIDPLYFGAFCSGDRAIVEKRFKVKTLAGQIVINDLTDPVKVTPRAIVQDADFFIHNENYFSPKENVYIHREAEVMEFVSLQPGKFPIIVDCGAKVRPFSIIDGPAYIGGNSLIDSAKIRGGTTIGSFCRIGGEVEESIIEDYSNKHHEGFIGHSYIGGWVNIGAMATTSDLKNNYGLIRLQIEDREIETGTIKFGSVICDFTKIGIGVMLNTGSVIGPGCNLFNGGEPAGKYTPPLTWGGNEVYREEKLVEDIRKMMKRRNKDLSPVEEALIISLNMSGE